MATQNQPSIVAAQMKSELECMKSFGPEKEKAILDRLPAEILSTIQHSTRIDLVPIEKDVILTEVILQVVGERDLFLWQRDQLLQSLSGPLLGTLVRGAVTLFGVTPKSFYKLAPRAWNRIFKQCGEMTVIDSGPTQMQIVLTDLASQIGQSHAYLVAITAALDAILVTTKVKGKVRVSFNSIPEKKVVFLAEWD